MKTQYEEERYRFFTEPENFKTMLDVVAHSEEVVKRLIQEFWLALEQQLHTDTESHGTAWLVGFSDAFDYRWNKLWIYQKAWCGEGTQPLVSIAFEDLQIYRHPYVGVHLLSDNKAYDCSTIKTALLNIEGAKAYKTDSNAYWALWKFLPFNLDYTQPMIRLLPENREVLIKELISEVTDLMDLITPYVADLIEKHKNP
jgi:hypothetical protein